MPLSVDGRSVNRLNKPIRGSGLPRACHFQQTQRSLLTALPLNSTHVLRSTSQASQPLKTPVAWQIHQTMSCPVFFRWFNFPLIQGY